MGGFYGKSLICAYIVFCAILLGFIVMCVVLGRRKSGIAGEKNRLKTVKPETHDGKVT